MPLLLCPSSATVIIGNIFVVRSATKTLGDLSQRKKRVLFTYDLQTREAHLSLKTGSGLHSRGIGSKVLKVKIIWSWPLRSLVSKVNKAVRMYCIFSSLLGQWDFPVSANLGSSAGGVTRYGQWLMSWDLVNGGCHRTWTNVSVSFRTYKTKL